MEKAYVLAFDTISFTFTESDGGGLSTLYGLTQLASTVSSGNISSSRALVHVVAQGIEEAHSTNTNAEEIVTTKTKKLPIDNRPSHAVQMAMKWLPMESAGKILPYAKEGTPNSTTTETVFLVLGEPMACRRAWSTAKVRGVRETPCQNLSSGFLSTEAGL